MDEEDFLAAVEADNVGAPVEDAPEPKKEEDQALPEPTPDPEPALEALTEPATPTEPPVVPQAPKQPDPGFVPVTAMLDERDKRKALEAELAQYRAQHQPQETPDVYDDPEGFARHQEQRVQQALYQTNLQWSERIATIQHGQEAVTAAKEWGIARCDSDPFFNAKVAASPDPVGYVVQEFKRDQIATSVDPAQYQQFLAWQSAQQQLSQQQAAPAVNSHSPPSIPPRSLASAPSAGGVMTEPAQSEKDIFEEVIPRK